MNLMESKIEASIPLRSGEDRAVEIIADSHGVQINVIDDGLCTHRINVNDELLFHLTEHHSSKKLLTWDLNWEND